MIVLQGVTLTELKEAKRTNNLPPPDRHTEEGASPEKGCCVMKGLTDDRGAQITEDTDEINKEKEIMDEVSRRKTCRRTWGLPTVLKIY